MVRKISNIIYSYKQFSDFKLICVCVCEGKKSVVFVIVGYNPQDEDKVRGNHDSIIMF